MPLGHPFGMLCSFFIVFSSMDMMHSTQAESEYKLAGTTKKPSASWLFAISNPLFYFVSAYPPDFTRRPTPGPSDVTTVDADSLVVGYWRVTSESTPAWNHSPATSVVAVSPTGPTHESTPKPTSVWHTRPQQRRTTEATRTPYI